MSETSANSMCKPAAKLGAGLAARRGARGGRPRGVLAGMRIRKKLIFLHTLFSVTLAIVLVLALRPAVWGVVEAAEQAKARELVAALRTQPVPEAGVVYASESARVRRITIEDIPADVDPLMIQRASTQGSVLGRALDGVRLVETGGDGTVWVADVRSLDARRAVGWVYALLVLAVVGVYLLIALALEVFVLPRHVYEPIRAMLRADDAAREGERAGELIPESLIPADEMGEIMRSRNDVVVALRRHEDELARTLQSVEQAATELKRKNHLLETARRNLEGADRLASLGMMSAGIAHELNTPLAVVKGLVDKLEHDPSRGLPEGEAKLLGRVVRRLERLGDSLLDFARARQPETRPVSAAEIIDEAATLVRLDRETLPDPSRIAIDVDVDSSLVVECDPGRMVQVFVNLIRNGVDAVRRSGGSGPAGRGAVVVRGERTEREGRSWVSVRVRDDGPGIDPDVLATLFEPFVSTRLDSRGTGLGLAVAEGIVREHDGVILARNAGSEEAIRGGAVFEVVLPASERAAEDWRSGGADGDEHAGAGSHEEAGR